MKIIFLVHEQGTVYLPVCRINWYCLEAFARVTGFSAMHLKYIFFRFPGNIRTLVLSDRFFISPKSVRLFQLLVGFEQLDEDKLQFKG